MHIFSQEGMVEGLENAKELGGIPVLCIGDKCGSYGATLAQNSYENPSNAGSNQIGLFFPSKHWQSAHWWEGESPMQNNR